MKTVKATRLHNYDGAVRVEETTLREPQSGELLVRVHAACVNPIDWKIRADYMRQVTPRPLPFTLGGDFSGVVEAVGPYVSGFKVGDEVYGEASIFNRGSGSFAECCIARAGAVALKPRSVSHADASWLPIAGVSALQALTKYLRVSASQRVLINGGAGIVGQLAIQLARHLGAHVVATASDDDIDYVKSLGADEVVAYGSREFEEVLVGFDAGLDTVGSDAYARPFRVMKGGVRLASMLEQPRPELMNNVWLESIALSRQVTTGRLTKLAEMVDEGALKFHVDETFPLELAGAALLRMETVPPRGQIVLKIAGRVETPVDFAAFPARAAAGGSYAVMR
jgi:NADPH:quinone reductase-like Zn-dependent oxidoreductase